jgi:hypothetical protein
MVKSTVGSFALLPRRCPVPYGRGLNDRSITLGMADANIKTLWRPEMDRGGLTY